MIDTNSSTPITYTECQYHGIDTAIAYGTHANGQIAIQLIATDTPNNKEKGYKAGVIYHTATVMVESMLPKHHTAIVDWGKPGNILSILRTKGLIKATSLQPVMVDKGMAQIVLVS